MKFKIEEDGTGTLIARVGNLKEYKEFKGLDLSKVHQWYPLNISYNLRYQEPRDRLYLYPVTNPPENPDYKYVERTRTKPEGTVIEDIGPDMMCANVMMDNVTMCIIADRLELPSFLTADYTEEQAKQGIKDVLEMLDSVKGTLENRLSKDMDIGEFRKKPLQEQDNMLYLYATDEEISEMKQFGKLYTMLNLMRKISKVRE